MNLRRLAFSVALASLIPATALAQKDIVDTISFCLEQEGYEVLSAFNGPEALGMARIELPDLMVLDVMLPKENGYQVSRYIREDEKAGKIEKHIIILMLTARGEEVDEVLGLEAVMPDGEIVPLHERCIQSIRVFRIE